MSEQFKNRLSIAFIAFTIFFSCGCTTTKPEKITLVEINRNAYKDIAIKDGRKVEKDTSADIDTFMGVGDRVSETLIDPPLLDAAKFYLGEFFQTQSFLHYQKLPIELVALDVAQVKGRAAPINNPAPVPGVGVLAAVLAGFVIQGIENFRVPDSLVAEVIFKVNDKKFKCNGAQQVKHRT